MEPHQEKLQIHRGFLLFLEKISTLSFFAHDSLNKKTSFYVPWGAYKKGGLKFNASGFD